MIATVQKYALAVLGLVLGKPSHHGGPILRSDQPRQLAIEIL
jgi:hypothetical protein